MAVLKTGRLLACAIASLAAAFVWIGAAAPLRAQSSDVRLLQDRVLRLERELEVMRQQVRQPPVSSFGAGTTGGGEVPPTAAAQMELRINQLESEIRALTGQVEQFEFNLRQMRDRMESLASDIDFRLSALEKAGAPPPLAAAGQPAAPDAAGDADTGGALATAGPPTETPTTGTPQEQYDRAKRLLRRAKYEEAEQALLAFVGAYPDSPLTGNALYWLGETYYVRGSFSQAAIRFAEGYKKFPDHPKGPDNLLKLGMSLAKLEKKREACASLSQIDRQYPNATNLIKRTAAAQSKKLQCR